MILNEVLGIQEIKNHNIRITTRQAVRAVILKDGKILMVHTNKGDYKFPGGGVKRQEELQEALIREVAEETGYIVETIGEKLGTIIQRNVNQFNANGIFEMTSHYYFCSVKDIPESQHLEKYEEDQEFEPVWISMDDVIKGNEMILQGNKEKINPWVYRETLALRRPKENGIG